MPFDGIPQTPIAPLDQNGVYKEGFGELTGKAASDVKDMIFSSLRNKGLLVRINKYTHRYPVCWRCSTELVFRLVDEWFISMDGLRDKIAEIARRVNWIPEFGLQRELDWLRNMDDWMISKKRFWGLALPIYKCDCGYVDVIGSETELEARAVEGWKNFQGKSPHRPWIDDVKIECVECSSMVSRIKDVGNVWLDAGIVPYSTIGYRNNREFWNEWFPADWISESFPGQFRGWFYSLLVMSTVLEETEPFRNLYSYATMRDEKGDEMHKSKGNAIWFEEGAEKMGVDSMRWLYARQNPASNLSFGFGTADDVRRQFIIPLWNVYSFFVTYANIDGYDSSAAAPAAKDRPELDRWILSELHSLTKLMTEKLDRYEPEPAAIGMEAFVEDLSNWYVRRSRRRFWKSETDADKIAAYSTLYECLLTVTKLLAPFVPFITESIYRNLVGPENRSGDSVHLESFPKVPARWQNEKLFQKWDKLKIVRNVANAAIEVKRSSKEIGSSLEADIKVYLGEEYLQHSKDVNLPEYTITSKAEAKPMINDDKLFKLDSVDNVKVLVKKAKGEKCSRCWKILESPCERKNCGLKN